MDNALKYKPTARLIHWVMAILVITMAAFGFVMVRQDLGLSREVQNFLFIAHKNTGVLLMILIVVRLAYRWRNPPQLAPVELPALQKLAADLTHVGLYALLVIMPLAGYIRVRAGGFPIEFLDRLGIPALVPRSDALAEFAKAVHHYGAYMIAALILAHVGAAAFHGIIRRDGIFSRMWPPIGK